ncbi:maintenance of ploidy protein MOB2 [Verticillium alfalfae VaMs.102]|uniref:Maintenance of ploidy protein MOB2 n=1 Tax=Verticillium alfalfae (strain VaMs.102 / ATCC MYA-4576 / FGSC 10136) TaxID=526221 RepID=C9STP3_VERA1|nr:maintenance of ploidy protein MOB2 [Verticillium alfalfae VaMs.102]EEY22204.1 maintenance of ploidy protein MOB2 [Verticillium alfalfae VaMs.102]
MSISSTSETLPVWLNPAYSRQIVKGNLMTLSARPKTVEQGEWIAHHGQSSVELTQRIPINLFLVVEHYRNLWNFVRVIHEKEEDGTTICNVNTCPKMSAGPNHSYTWLNNRYQPVELPAHEYMTLMQRWIGGKINDTNLFPTDPNGVSYAPNPSLTSSSSTSSLADPASNAGAPPDEDWVGRRSGFPKEFAGVCRTIFLQMFRVYAHLYHNHFVDPLYHLNLEKQLNSCFSHFVLTATALDLLKKEDLEPMQGLVDLWAASGTFPPESKAYQYANLENGNRIWKLAAF